MMQQAGFLAERLEQEAGQTAARPGRSAPSRWPSSASLTRDELAAAAQLVREQGLAVFCRALFNANEFVYVF